MVSTHKIEREKQDQYVSFPVNRNRHSKRTLGIIYPFSLINKEKIDSLGFSPQEMYRATICSGFKIASAKEYLRDLNESYQLAAMDQSYSLPLNYSERQKFLNSNLLHIIAVTDRNEDTIGHSQLVSRYTLLLARYLGIEDSEFLTAIETGALLHDIGKIGIPESILRKPGALTTAEREVVKEHPMLGYSMIEEMDFLKKAAQVVLYHHEHFDGRGYPYGLAGDEIPLEARMFALADTLDAMTSDRPYRRAGGFGEALAEIERYSGIQFDPLLVDTLLSIPVEMWHQIKREPYAFSTPPLTN